MAEKRITILCGHYGSGKTNLAVHLALEKKKHHERVALADLDIVNPYFRAKDAAEQLEQAGIRLICSAYANSNVDMPALPQEMYIITEDKAQTAVLDIGGDDRGALVLGRLTPAILAENDYEMLLVINCYRPLTTDADDTVEIMHEMEQAGGIRFTGIINNSNLGAETTAETVLASLPYAEAISEQTGLPIVLTGVDEKLLPELAGKIPNLFPMHIQRLQIS